MIDAPIASRISTWKSNVNTGTTITPPPRPTNEPSTPAKIEISANRTTKSKGDTLNNLAAKDSGKKPVGSIGIRKHLWSV